jgi:hypothetical protein
VAQEASARIWHRCLCHRESSLQGHRHKQDEGESTDLYIPVASFFLLARLNSAFDGVRQPSSISNFPVLVPIPRYQVLIQGTTHRLPCTCPLMSQVPSHILIEVSSVWWVFRMKLPVHHGGTLYDICCGGQETHTDDIFSHYMTVFKGIVCTRPIAGNPG